MRAILILGPYILIPMLAAIGVKMLNWPKGVTYVITFIIFLIYPFLIAKIDDYNNPPPPGPSHNDAQQFYLIGSYLFFLPMALVIQLLVNWIYFKRVGKIVK